MAMQVMEDASLFQRCMVKTKLAEIGLFKEGESHSLFDCEHRLAPAEVGIEESVEYNEPMSDVYGHRARMHDVWVEHRTKQVIIIEEHSSVVPNLINSLVLTQDFLMLTGTQDTTSRSSFLTRIKNFYLFTVRLAYGWNHPVYKSVCKGKTCRGNERHVLGACARQET